MLLLQILLIQLTLNELELLFEHELMDQFLVDSSAHHRHTSRAYSGLVPMVNLLLHLIAAVVRVLTELVLACAGCLIGQWQVCAPVELHLVVVVCCMLGAPRALYTLALLV